MPGAPSREGRESLLFGAVVALAGLLATFGAHTLARFDRSRDAKILSSLSGATSIDATSIRPDLPKTGPRGVFAIQDAKGLEYATILSISSPDYTGLVAAFFSPDGRVDTIKEAASLRSTGNPSGVFPLARAGEANVAPGGEAEASILAGPLAPAAFDLLRSLSSVSRAIAATGGKGQGR